MFSLPPWMFSLLQSSWPRWSSPQSFSLPLSLSSSQPWSSSQQLSSSPLLPSSLQQSFSLPLLLSSSPLSPSSLRQSFSLPLLLSSLLLSLSWPPQQFSLLLRSSLCSLPWICLLLKMIVPETSPAFLFPFTVYCIPRSLIFQSPADENHSAPEKKQPACLMPAVPCQIGYLFSSFQALCNPSMIERCCGQAASHAPHPMQLSAPVLFCRIPRNPQLSFGLEL